MAGVTILDSKELKNFLAFNIIRPSEWYSISSFYANKLWFKIALKIFGHLYFYPPYIKKIYKSLDLTHNSDRLTFISMCNELEKLSSSKMRKIMLTFGELDIQNLNDNWEIEYNDIEQYWSLHRWGWLLIALTHSSHDLFPDTRIWGLTNIKKWLCAYIDKKETWAWKDTYTVGERIVNSILFCVKSSLDNNLLRAIPLWLEQPLVEHGEFMLRHLEYYNEINNHIINNARALYILGTFFNKKIFREIGREIVRNELEKLITPSGFLREGSSHYHFLFTRWLLEILWSAKLIRDTSMVNLLAPILQKAVKACYLFLIWNHLKNSWELPLIGDISPDFEPKWLINLPWAKEAISCYTSTKIYMPPKEKGWANLFELKESSEIPELINSYNNVQYYKEDGWIRIDCSFFTLLWHIIPTGVPLFPNHAHCDTLSFCCYVKGFPLIVDPGRFNYCKEGLWGVKACSHNSVTIDGLDPFPFDKRLPFCYSISNVRAYFEKENETIFRLIISHDGFNRLYNDKILHVRIFTISPNMITIEDKFTGKKFHNIQTFFHLHPEVSISSKNKNNLLFKINKEKQNLMIKFSWQQKFSDIHVVEADEDNKYGWYYPAYGRKEKAKTIIFSKKARFPYLQKFILEID